MVCLHLWHHPIVIYQDFCALLELKLSWGAKVMLRVIPESARNILNSLIAKSILAGEKLIATYSISM